jgi:hypothetical protein
MTWIGRRLWPDDVETATTTSQAGNEGPAAAPTRLDELRFAQVLDR